MTNITSIIVVVRRRRIIPIGTNRRSTTMRRHGGWWYGWIRRIKLCYFGYLLVGIDVVVVVEVVVVFWSLVIWVSPSCACGAVISVLFVYLAQNNIMIDSNGWDGLMGVLLPSVRQYVKTFLSVSKPIPPSLHRSPRTSHTTPYTYRYILEYIGVSITHTYIYATNDYYIYIYIYI